MRNGAGNAHQHGGFAAWAYSVITCQLIDAYRPRVICQTGRQFATFHSRPMTDYHHLFTRPASTDDRKPLGGRDRQTEIFSIAFLR